MLWVRLMFQLDDTITFIIKKDKRYDYDDIYSPNISCSFFSVVNFKKALFIPLTSLG